MYSYHTLRHASARVYAIGHCGVHAVVLQVVQLQTATGNAEKPNNMATCSVAEGHKANI